MSIRSSPCLTNCPSWKLIFVICPSTRLCTVTVLNAVTVPSPLKYTGRSPRCAVATTTGTTNPPAPAPCRPCPLPDPPGAAGPCASVLACDPRKYQKPTAPIAAKAMIHNQWPFDAGSRRTGRSPEGSGPAGLALKWPIHTLLRWIVVRASMPLARNWGKRQEAPVDWPNPYRTTLLIRRIGRLAEGKGYEHGSNVSSV